MRIAVVAITVMCLSVAQAATPSPETDKAKVIFASYQRLERAYDPAIADLYCDSAVIRNTRTYPDGQIKVLEIPAPKYKALIRSAMPAAKAAGDYSEYSDIAYASEGSSVRISSTRFGVLKKYSSPISILVGACEGGDWAILEEISQSRP